MKILTSKSSHLADQSTIQKDNISSLDLMERAANQFFAAFLNRFPDAGPGIIVCGPGNNGGDGLVFARLLHQSGRPVRVFLPEGFGRFSEEWLANRNRLPSEIPVYKGNPTQLAEVSKGCLWLCDALFGSGLNKPLEGDILNLVKEMNQFDGLKISIDVPSGLWEDWSMGDHSFQANWTGTFQTPKLNFLLPDTGEFTDEFEVIPIGLETREAEKFSPPYFYTLKMEIREFFSKRPKFSHKGSFGHGLIFAGGLGKSGAAVLAAGGLVRSGVGLATMAVPKCTIQSIHSVVPEAMVIPDDHDHFLGQFPELAPYHAIGIGPGIGQHEETAWLLKELIFTSQIHLVLDADALNILAKHPDWIRHLPPKTILTPHPGEWKRLVGETKNSKEQLDQVSSFATDHQAIIVLKGAHTRVFLPDGSVHFNSTGNPGMASGGMGDVLTGLITGLLAKGMEPEKAAIAAVYLHGLAGDIAAKESGQESLSATDLIQKIGSAYKELLA